MKRRAIQTDVCMARKYEVTAPQNTAQMLSSHLVLYAEGVAISVYVFGREYLLSCLSVTFFSPPLH